MSSITLNLNNQPTKLNISQNDKTISYTMKEGRLYNDNNEELTLTLAIDEEERSCITDSQGTKRWYNSAKKCHRDNDKPAITYTNGDKEWFIDGKHHRDGDKPSCEYSSKKLWHTNGILTRDNDLPAIEYTNGDKYWYKDAKLHRDNDLPAVEKVDGYKEWYQHGLKHRLGNDLPSVLYSDNSKLWYKDDKLHRDNDLPAILYYYDNKECKKYDFLPITDFKVQYMERWYKDGQLHRDENKPAVIHYDKDMGILRMMLYKDGQLVCTLNSA
jgi:hypothetical protein